MPTSQGTFTVADVVTDALRKSGIIGLGQTPDGSDTLDAADDLSDMLAQWNVKTWLVFEKLDLGFVSDGRAGPGLGGAYTVGPGGNFNCTPRPDRVEAAYLRILANTNVSGSGMPVDQPLRQMFAREDYSRIALKQLVAFPRGYFYDTASPLGNLFIYPWPQANLYETHIIIKNSFPLYLPLNTDLSMLPPEVRAAMKFCLARRLRQGYGKGLRPDPELNALAKDALSTMRNSHIQVPELVMPQAVLGRGSLYNVYGDIFYAIASFGVALSSIMCHAAHWGGLFT